MQASAACERREKLEVRHAHEVRSTEERHAAEIAKLRQQLAAAVVEKEVSCVYVHASIKQAMVNMLL